MKITTIILALVLLTGSTGAQTKPKPKTPPIEWATASEWHPAKPGKAAKPLTTDGLAITLLRLAERAEAQEMRVEAQVIREAASKVLTGTPAK